MIKVTIAWGQSPCEDQIETYKTRRLSSKETTRVMVGSAVIGDDVKDEQGNIIMHTSYDGDLDEYLIAVEEGRA